MRGLEPMLALSVSVCQFTTKLGGCLVHTIHAAWSVLNYIASGKYEKVYYLKSVMYSWWFGTVRFVWYNVSTVSFT